MFSEALSVMTFLYCLHSAARGHDGRREMEELYFAVSRQTTKGKQMEPSARVGTSCCSPTIVLSVFREREEIAHALVSSYIDRSACFPLGSARAREESVLNHVIDSRISEHTSEEMIFSLFRSADENSSALTFKGTIMVMIFDVDGCEIFCQASRVVKFISVSIGMQMSGLSPA